MKLNQLADNPGAIKDRKRIGRGIGSGTGKTGGRGVKGQKSRSGVAIKGFEGGQMPLHRRMPKRGFTNPFSKKWSIVNIGRIQQAIEAGKLDAGKMIDAAALIESGVIRREKDGVRLLGNGEIKSKVQFTIACATKSAVEAVEKAGGSVTLTAKKPAKAE